MTKIQQIAKDFIAAHKNDEPGRWFLQCSCLKTDDYKYIEIYKKLETGVFGECNKIGDDEFEVVINKLVSKSGNSISFAWNV